MHILTRSGPSSPGTSALRERLLEFEGEAPDQLAEAGPHWVATAPVREHLFLLAAQTGVPWFALLDCAGWPPRLARRMGMGPIPRRIPEHLADTLLELDPDEFTAATPLVLIAA